MSAVTPWICPTCGQSCSGKFCSNCGERALHPHDLTLLGLGEEVVEQVTHTDGRIFHTFASLIRRPGELTDSYVRGSRRPVLGPLQVFLIANVIFFGMQSLFHASVFSNPLRQHVQGQYYSGLATRLVEARIASLHTTLERYEPAFDHAVIVNAKSLIILMTPPMALLAFLLFYTRRKPFVTHVVFAIHFYAFWLLAFCVAGPVIAVGILLFTGLSGVHLESHQLDSVMSYGLFTLAGVYLASAAGRVYGGNRVLRVAKALLLAFTAGVMVIGYRLVVFLITLYTTGA